jgi:nucleotide-binding universal stress UspA family protein
MIEKNLQETRLQEARNACEKRADELEELTGLRPETEVSVGEAARVVLEAAGDGTTLIVMGSRGLGAVRRMALGSVSTKVLQAAEDPVLIFPHG